MLRILMISVWIIGSFLLWILFVASGIICVAIVAKLKNRAASDFIPLSIFVPVIVIGCFGIGSLLAICAAVVLALKGKLPGTQRLGNTPNFEVIRQSVD
jgi:hypothetical protein